jgi:hypothetical protein
MLDSGQNHSGFDIRSGHWNSSGILLLELPQIFYRSKTTRAVLQATPKKMILK